FSSSGGKLRTEFQVSSFTVGVQGGTFGGTPPGLAVAVETSGAFVVSWNAFDGAADGVFVQRFASSGARVGTEFQVNTSTQGSESDAEIFALPNDGFAVTWRDTGHDGSQTAVFGQLIVSSGSRLGINFQVNSYTLNFQQAPAIGGQANGNFVVVWQSY